jgi:hypothetical protein
MVDALKMAKTVQNRDNKYVDEANDSADEEDVLS